MARYLPYTVHTCLPYIPFISACRIYLSYLPYCYTFHTCNIPVSPAIYLSYLPYYYTSNTCHTTIPSTCHTAIPPMPHLSYLQHQPMTLGDVKVGTIESKCGSVTVRLHKLLNGSHLGWGIGWDGWGVVEGGGGVRMWGGKWGIGWRWGQMRWDRPHRRGKAFGPSSQGPLRDRVM